MQYTELARLAPVCFGCKLPSDGTQVLAHRNLNGWGMLSGRGIKGLSAAGAILCSVCHGYGDGEGQNDHHWWELAHQRTLTWAYNEGYLRFNPKGGEPDERLR